MAESLSRLGGRGRSMEPPKAATKEPKNVDDAGENPEGDEAGHHAAAESLHASDPGSKHMIVSHDGYSYKSHGIHEDGKHEPEQGTHDHENIEELKSHLGKFFNEEEGEGKHEDGGMEPEENQSLY